MEKGCIFLSYLDWYGSLIPMVIDECLDHDPMVHATRVHRVCLSATHTQLGRRHCASAFDHQLVITLRNDA